MHDSQVQTVAPLLITVLVVLRLAFRELRDRTVKAGRLWFAPAVLVILTGFTVWSTIAVDPGGLGEMLVALAAGAILGAVTGWSIVRYTRFEPAATPNAVRVRASRVTFAIWVGALALRIAARYLIPHGGDQRTQLPLNCGTVAFAAVAFIIVAWAFHRAIATYGRTGSAGAA